MAWIFILQRFGKAAHFSRCTFKGYKGGLFAGLLVGLAMSCLPAN